MLLSALLAPFRRLSLVGLAKNTGKTETLMTALREFQAQGHVVGVTSIGRDGEEWDAINNGISKPRIHLAANSLVATTDVLIQRSGIPTQLLDRTSHRTAMGQVVISRLLQDGLVEVAGPTAREDIRTVTEAMLDFGADRVFIDGAINRRTAASPSVADGVTVSTGAVLHTQIEEVVRATTTAVDLCRLPEVNDSQIRQIAASIRENVFVTDDYQVVPLSNRVALVCDVPTIRQIAQKHRNIGYIIVQGAVCEDLIESVLHAGLRKHLTIVAADSTRVFLSKHASEWYRRQGITIEVLTATKLVAITVNPVSPLAHSFDSRLLRELIMAAIPGVPVFDVLAPDYGVPIKQSTMRDAHQVGLTREVADT